MGLSAGFVVPVHKIALMRQDARLYVFVMRKDRGWLGAVPETGFDGFHHLILGKNVAGVDQ